MVNCAEELRAKPFIIGGDRQDLDPIVYFLHTLDLFDGALGIGLQIGLAHISQ